MNDFEQVAAVRNEAQQEGNLQSAVAEKLADHFAALEAERQASWPTEKLQQNLKQRQDLLRRFDPARAVRPGDTVAPFTLEAVDGTPVVSAALVQKGFAVLIFFRFATCPACNIALPYYARQLWPALAAAGVPLVAISPQVRERLVEIRDRHSLPFTVATDGNNDLARSFGILFEPDPVPAVVPGESWLGEVTGTGTWELPQPAIVIIDERHQVRHVQISPDWLNRPEASDILDALDDLGALA